MLLKNLNIDANNHGSVLKERNNLPDHNTCSTTKATVSHEHSNQRHSGTHVVHDYKIRSKTNLGTKTGTNPLDNQIGNAVRIGDIDRMKMFQTNAHIFILIVRVNGINQNVKADHNHTKNLRTVGCSVALN